MAVRDRYNGTKRNPWNEFECGSNYARSMASYALLLAFSGFEYDMYNKSIGFSPIDKGDFNCLWSLDSGWGEVDISAKKIELKVLYGELSLNSYTQGDDKVVSKVTVDGNEVEFTQNSKTILLSTNVTITKNLCICY